MMEKVEIYENDPTKSEKIKKLMKLRFKRCEATYERSNVRVDELIKKIDNEKRKQKDSENNDNKKKRIPNTIVTTNETTESFVTPSYSSSLSESNRVKPLTLDLDSSSDDDSLLDRIRGEDLAYPTFDNNCEYDNEVEK